ncbi:MAG: Fe-S cluster assembly protein SufB, partial [Lachnospiraceae bacterium]|nr:Fe-S cluster assembly protein SufB [Lachnospiraceae bacterium]
MSDNKMAVADINHSLYDFKDIENEQDFYRMEEGLSRETVLKVSEEKNDPDWMREFRLQCLDLYNRIKMPNWGPSIEGLDMDKISSYVRHKSDMKGKWEDVPEDIKNTFEKLGIPQAERESLAGVGAQYDSELVYHNVRDEVAAQGVIYTDLESAL